jgi:hypothetical protein
MYLSMVSHDSRPPRLQRWRQGNPAKRANPFWRIPASSIHEACSHIFGACSYSAQMLTRILRIGLGEARPMQTFRFCRGLYGLRRTAVSRHGNVFWRRADRTQCRRLLQLPTTLHSINRCERISTRLASAWSTNACTKYLASTSCSRLSTFSWIGQHGTADRCIQLGHSTLTARKYDSEASDQPAAGFAAKRCIM